jgi:signal transduction histidine kinase
MRISKHQRIRIEFGMALLLVLIVGAMVFRSVHELTWSAEREERSRNVLRRLEPLDGISLGMPSAQGDVRVGADREYLVAIDTALPSATLALASLDRLVTGEVTKRRLVDSLRALTRDQSSLVREALGDTARTTSYVRQEQALARRMRRVIRAIKAVEMAQFETRWNREKESAVRMLLLSVVGFLLACAIMLSAIYRVEQHLAERLAAEARALEAKQTAERASRAKSHFLACVSHELRTPLNAVIGFSNVLMRDRHTHLAEDERSYLDRIRANGMHLLGLIDDILDLARIESGTPRLTLEPVDLGQLVRETVSQLEVRLLGSDVALRVDLPARASPIETDRGKLKQVLINLIGNAITWTDAGSITVRVRTDGASDRPVQVDVIDTGAGIAPAQQQTLFVAFANGSKCSAPSRGGTGLGLPISKSLCQLLGYDLTVSSEVGHGTTFSIAMSDRRITAEAPVREPVPVERAAVAAPADAYASPASKAAALRTA